MFASVVCANIDTCNTSAFAALVRIFPQIKSRLRNGAFFIADAHKVPYFSRIFDQLLELVALADNHI